MTEVVQPTAASTGALPGADERWTLTTLLRDAAGAPYFLAGRLTSASVLGVLSGYRDDLYVHDRGTREAAELTAAEGGLRLALDLPALSCRLDVGGLDADGVSLPGASAAGSVTYGEGIRVDVSGPAWIERSWAAAPERGLALQLSLDSGERLKIERPASATPDDAEVATTGWISATGGDWLPWGWRCTLPSPFGAVELEPYSRRDVHEDGGRARFLGAARLLRADGPIGFAIAEAVAAPAPAAVVTTPRPHARVIPEGPPAFTLGDVGVTYGDTPAVGGVTLDIPQRAVTALIGPSGSGKSTLIRVLNRMNDLVLSATVTGEVRFHGQDLYSRDIDPVQVRRRIGMVFQKPNPFPKSIYDNVAFGPRALRMDDHLDERVEEALRRAALWEEVADRLHRNAFSLSGGQQQRLIIARALATRPDVLLMDEPASALDPFSTARIEDLMIALRDDLTIVVVTHNMQQAARVADKTAFMTVEDGIGTLVEFAPTEEIFVRPKDPRTEAYVTGRFG